MFKKIWFSILIISSLIISGCSSGPADEVKLNLAKCLTEKGAVMFGAYWCPHCQQQKKDLWKAWEEINYVECSLPGGKGQTEACQQAKIESYPTWEFAPGDRTVGKLSFEELSAKSGCVLG